MAKEAFIQPGPAVGTQVWEAQQRRGWVYERQPGFDLIALGKIDDPKGIGAPKGLKRKVEAGELAASNDIPPDLDSNPAFNQLCADVTLPFQTRIGFVRFEERNGSTTIAKKSVYTPIKFFQNGNTPYSFREFDARGNKRDVQKDAFSERVRGLLAIHCGEFFDPTSETGFKSETDRKKFEAIQSVVPDIVNSMTSRDNYITMVQEDQAPGIIEGAIKKIKNPDASFAIRLGYGGSDDPFTSSRYDAYGIPAFRIATQIQEAFNRFERKKVHEAEHTKGGKLTDQEKGELKTQYGIPDHAVTVQIVHAHEAAIGTETKDPEKTRVRAQKNLSRLSKFNADHFPDVDVEYIVDTPWNEHPAITQLSRDYKIHLLMQGEQTDPHIKAIMENVRGMGQRQGGDKGAANSMGYAAEHVTYFSDMVDLPLSPYFKTTDAITGKPVTINPDILITIGGAPEKEFCAVRQFIREQANAEDFMSFALVKNAEAWQKEGVAKYDGAIAQIREYMRSSERDRNRARTRVSLITELGKTPVYYLTDRERRLGPTVVLTPGESVEIEAIDRERRRVALAV